MGKPQFKCLPQDKRHRLLPTHVSFTSNFPNPRTTSPSAPQGPRMQWQDKEGPTRLMITVRMPVKGFLCDLFG